MSRLSLTALVVTTLVLGVGGCSSSDDAARVDPNYPATAEELILLGQAEWQLTSGYDAQEAYRAEYGRFADPSIEEEFAELREIDPWQPFVNGEVPDDALIFSGDSPVWLSLSGSTLYLAARVTDTKCAYGRADSTRPSEGMSWAAGNCVELPEKWESEKLSDSLGEKLFPGSGESGSADSGPSTDRAAQSNLRTALSAQNLYYVNFRTYANPSVTTELDTLRRYEPALQYLTGASPAVTLTGPGQPEVWVSVAGSTLIMAAQATESVCFYLRNDPDPASNTPGQSWGKSECTKAPESWTAQPPTSS